MAKNKLATCPNCGKAFNDHEFVIQECEKCGWPDSDDDDGFPEQDRDILDDYYLDELN